MSPADAMDNVINKVMMFSRYKKPGRPGEIIECLPPEYREALKKLTAKDINVRKEYVWNNNQNEGYSNIKF